MKTFAEVLVFLFVCLTDKKRVESLGLTALNDSYHAMTLLETLNNEDYPLDSDPASSDPEVRRNICEDIANSEFPKFVSAGSIDFTKVYNDLRHPGYREIFDLIYNSDGEYTNSYRLLEFFGSDADGFKEHVFLCLSRFWSFGEIFPFFVSKEYDVAEPGRPYKRGRFVFAFENFKPMVHSPIWYDYAILAEEPAIVHARPETEFNVELYFLNTRKYIPSAESGVFDPLCKLVSDDEEDPKNQHYRFCVAISRSSEYEKVFQYPRWSFAHCEVLEVSFRTPRGRERAAGKRYYEQMMPCFSRHPTFMKYELQTEENYFFVSRAYTSDRVLVYELDSTNGNIYLKNLSGNVSIVDELNSFDIVEE